MDTGIWIAVAVSAVVSAAISAALALATRRIGVGEAVAMGAVLNLVGVVFVAMQVFERREGD